MARFRVDAQGDRGKTSRQGSKNSGIWSHTRGWHTGVFVTCHVDEEGYDECEVYESAGSAGYGSRRERLLARVSDNPDVDTFVLPEVRDDIDDALGRVEDVRNHLMDEGCEHLAEDLNQAHYSLQTAEEGLEE